MQAMKKTRRKDLPKKNFCFACGPNNPQGMHLQFHIDEIRRRVTGTFRLGKRYTGPPAHCHGGIIATILDDAMGKLNKVYGVVAVTSKMTVEYLRPVPLNKRLHVESRHVSRHGRRLKHIAEIRDPGGTVLARSQGLFIAIDPEKVFG